MMHSDPFLPSQSIHFTGICGVGMTALALCLQDKGMAVSGSDTGEQFVTSEVLRSRNIPASAGFDPEGMTTTLNGLVYTGSHSGSQNPQVLAAKRLKIPVYSHAEALGILSKTKRTIAICGVGGKTTTSAMLATIFAAADLDPSYAIGVGGVSTLDFPGRWNSTGEHFIVEADEYANSPGTDATPRFTFLRPETIVCTGLAHDHPDVYASLADVQQAFARFFALLPEQGTLVACGDSAALQAVLADFDRSNVITYGMQPHNQWQIVSIGTKDQQQTVMIKDPKGNTLSLALQVPGAHNALNALAACIVAESYGISRDVVIASVGEFKGTKRRFEILGNRRGVTFVDDYAHHPNEIQATLKAAREWFEGRRLIIVFQPHTFSRTKTLFTEFAHSFGLADKVVITDIFASAREDDDPTISASMLTDAVNKLSNNAHFVTQDKLESEVSNLMQTGDVVMTMGAGDIYKLHEQLSGAKA